jgi:hypothetical protein
MITSLILWKNPKKLQSKKRIIAGNTLVEKAVMHDCTQFLDRQRDFFSQKKAGKQKFMKQGG